MLVRALVIWFGVFQALHAVFGARYVLVERRFMLGAADHIPFPAPPGGWQRQAIDAYAAMGAVDLVISALSVVFVLGYLRGKTWSAPLGLVCLTVSVYAGIVFNWGTLASDAWGEPGNLAGYLLINIPWLPNVVLFVMVVAAGLRGKWYQGQP